MKIAVCDDEERFREDIRERIDRLYGSLDVIVDAYSDGRELIKRFSDVKYDVVFLDIEMPAMDGITLAKKLRAMSEELYIIFLTGHVEYAVEGYEVNALRYLTKPVQEDKLREVLKYVDAKNLSERRILIKTDGEDVMLSVSKVIFMEAQNQYVMIYATDGNFLVRYNLADFEKELRADHFFRVHRSYLVSLAKVRGIGNGECRMDGGRRVPVSRSNLKALKEALQGYLAQEAF